MGRLIRANVYRSNSILQSGNNYGYQQNIVIPNTLEIEIVNISSLQTACFINASTTDASILYIHFPIGSGDAYLTELEWAKLMICYAPDQWQVEKVIDSSEYGVYFKIYPLRNIDLPPGEKIHIRIEHLVSFGTLDKMVYVAVRVPAIQMIDKSLPEADKRRLVSSDEGTDYLPYFKTVEPLRIVQFECDHDQVGFGDKVILKWTVYGELKRCVLTPGDIEVDREGSLEVEVFENTIFQLYAFGEQQQMSQTTQVKIEPAMIVSFDSVPPEQQDTTKLAVTLTYEVKNARYVYVDQGIGRLEAKAGVVIVEPSRMQTVYTLSCMGPDGLIQKKCTVSSAYYIKQEADFMESLRVPPIQLSWLDQMKYKVEYKVKSFFKWW